MKMIFLVDGDNNIGTGLKGVNMLSEQDTVLIFYQKGLPLNKIQKLCEGSKASIQYIESVRGGKNSIDFQIITELGDLAGCAMPTRSRRWDCGPRLKAAYTCRLS